MAKKYMNLYIGDTHFGHQNIIRYDSRPFKSVEEMDEVMIQLWNGRVQPDDDVWFLGDLCHKSGRPPEAYLRRLSGRKHLIVGNHDDALLNNDSAMSHFETVDQLRKIEDTYKGEKAEIILCHYRIKGTYEICLTERSFPCIKISSLAGKGEKFKNNSERK